MIFVIVGLNFLIGSILTTAGEKKKNKPTQIIGYIFFILCAIIPFIEIIKNF